MALKPMHDVVFGEPVVNEESDLQKDLDLLTSEFDHQAPSTMSTDLSLNRRQLSASLDGRKQSFIVTILACGPDCTELEPGDIAILPPGTGTMITVVDEDTMEAERVYAIRESSVMARWRDED